MSDCPVHVTGNLESRVVALEKFEQLHTGMHEAEEKARTIALDGLKEKMHALNDVRNRFVDKEWFEKTHEKLESKVNENFAAMTHKVNNTAQTLHDRIDTVMQPYVDRLSAVEKVYWKILAVAGAIAIGAAFIGWAFPRGGAYLVGK
jgi:hypothetical protein